MNRLVFEIIADASRFAQGMTEAEAGGSRFTDAMRRLQEGARLTIPEIQDAVVAISEVGRRARESGGDLDLLNQHTTLLTRAQVAIQQELQREQRAMEAAAEEARRQAEAMQALTLEHYDLNRAQQIVHRETRRYASHARVKELSQERLVEMGIRTTEQIEEEIRQLELVMKQYEHDEAVTLQLSAAKERLQRSLGRVTTSQTAMLSEQRRANMMMTSGIRALGHFGGAYSTVGNQVVYAVQNIVVARQQMGSWQAAVGVLTRSLMGPGALIAAVGAAGIAIKKLSDQKKEAAKEAEEYERRISSVAGQLVRMEQLGEPVQISRQQAKEVLDSLEEQEAALRSLQGELQTAGIAAEGFVDAELKHIKLAREVVQSLADDYEAARLAREALQRAGVNVPDYAGEVRKVRTLMEAEAERYSELRRQLAELSGPEGDRVIQLQLQADALERQRDALIRIRRILEQMTLEQLEPQRIRVLPTPDEARSALVRAPGETELRESGMRDAERDRLEKSLEDHATYYDRLDVLRLHNQQSHEAMLERMGMSQAEWLSSTTQGLEALQAIAEQSFGGFASFAEEMYLRSGNAAKGWFAVHKAVSVAEAIASTYVAANKAATAAPWPFNAALVAGAIAQGMANVSRIQRLSIGSSSGAASTSGSGAAGFYSPSYQSRYPDDVIDTGRRTSGSSDLARTLQGIDRTLQTLSREGVGFQRDAFNRSVREDQYVGEFLS